MTLRSSLFHRTCASSPVTGSCPNTGYPAAGDGLYKHEASPAACAGTGTLESSMYASGCSSFIMEAT